MVAAEFSLLTVPHCADFLLQQCEFPLAQAPEVFGRQQCHPPSPNSFVLGFLLFCQEGEKGLPVFFVQGFRVVAFSSGPSPAGVFSPQSAGDVLSSEDTTPEDEESVC